jgi:hypothetical protein
VFKTKAGQLEKALKAKGFQESISANGDFLNGERPRKGSFVVSLNGKVVCELLDMPRPFTKLRNTDVDELADTILQG